MGVLAFFCVKDDKMEKERQGHIQRYRGTPEDACRLDHQHGNFLLQLCVHPDVLLSDSVHDRTAGSCRCSRRFPCIFQKMVLLFGNVGGGFITDKVGTGRMLLISFLVMAAGIIVIMLLPLSPASTTIFVILYIIVYIFYNVNYAMTWAMMDEGAIPERLSGSAAGVISHIGYLPEIFCSLLAGKLAGNNQGVEGYRMIFIFLTVMLLIGAVFVLIWMRYLKKIKKQEKIGSKEAIVI